MAITNFKHDSGLTGFQGNSAVPFTGRGDIKLPETLNLKGKFLMAAHGNDPCIVVYPARLHEQFSAHIISPPEELALDNRRRLRPSETLASRAELEPGVSRATIAGLGKYIEIWSAENWKRHIDDICAKGWSEDDLRFFAEHGVKL